MPVSFWVAIWALNLMYGGPSQIFFLVRIYLTCQNIFPAGITVKLESVCDNFYWHPSGLA